MFGIEEAKSRGMESFDFPIALNFYMKEPKYFLQVFFIVFIFYFSVTSTFRNIHLSSLSYKGTSFCI